MKYVVRVQIIEMFEDGTDQIHTFSQMGVDTSVVDLPPGLALRHVVSRVGLSLSRLYHGLFQYEQDKTLFLPPIIERATKEPLVG
ncbi:MAG: hypothetical protein GY906_37020 [bacterium]|nr:hypothetical protein [bacterium]